MNVSWGIVNVTLSIVLLTQLAVPAVFAQLRPATRESDITLENKFLRVNYQAQTGKMDIVWSKGNQLIGIDSGAQLADGQSLLTSAYTAHELVSQPVGAGGKEGPKNYNPSSEPGKPYQAIIAGEICAAKAGGLCFTRIPIGELCGER